MSTTRGAPLRADSPTIGRAQPPRKVCARTSSAYPVYLSRRPSRRWDDRARQSLPRRQRPTLQVVNSVPLVELSVAAWIAGP